MPPEGRPSSTTEPLLLRPAGADDVHAMAAVHVAARRAGRMPNSLFGVTEVAAALSGALGTDTVWVAELDGRLAGYVRLVEPDGRRRGWLDDLYVCPEAAGQGVGTALLDLARALLPAGFGLWVFAENHPARRFYRARGLVEVGETDGSENPEGAPEVEMAWAGSTTAGRGRGPSRPAGG